MEYEASKFKVHFTNEHKNQVWNDLDQSLTPSTSQNVREDWYKHFLQDQDNYVWQTHWQRHGNF